MCASKALAIVWTLGDLEDPPILVHEYWIHICKYKDPRMEMEIDFRNRKEKRMGKQMEKSKAAQAAIVAHTIAKHYTHLLPRKAVVA